MLFVKVGDMIGTTTPLGELAEKHHDRRSGQIKPSTQASEKSAVRKLVAWWGKKPPAHLTPAAFDEFLYGPDGLKQPRKPGVETMRNNSFNKLLDDLKPFISRLVTMGVVKPELLVQLKEARRKGGGRSHKRLSKMQIQYAVEHAPDPYERWIVAFASLSMGREGELLDTRMSDFNLEIRKIDWDRPKVDDFDDGLPMLDELVNEYTRWRDHYTQVCPAVDGDSYAIPSRQRVSQGTRWMYKPRQHPANIGGIIKRNYAAALGVSVASLPGQAAHMARRSGARSFFDQLVEAGIPDPIRIVQAMLGHDKQATTEIYIGLDADRERRDRLVTFGEAAKLMNWTDNNVIDLRRIGDG